MKSSSKMKFTLFIYNIHKIKNPSKLFIDKTMVILYATSTDIFENIEDMEEYLTKL